MDHALQRLTALQAPPRSPEAPGTPGAWQEVECRLGLVFPEHYKDYIKTFGAGQWASFFGIMDPFYRWKHPQATDYFRWMKTRLEGLDELRVEYPKDVVPFNRHPAPGGLVPFGYDDNGGTLCFQVLEQPASWLIVLLSSKFSGPYDTFSGTVAGFLCAVLEEQFLPKTWPADVFPIQQPAFRPYTTE